VLEVRWPKRCDGEIPRSGDTATLVVIKFLDFVASQN